MTKSNTSGIPGAGAMTDTLEFVKSMWGGMKIPGMVMPTLSVDDINRQITDLKAVESWLTLNMSMLRGTIQALEVQSATIATLQSMSESMSSMIKPGTAATEEKPGFESPFSFPMPTAAKPAAPDSDSDSDQDSGFDSRAQPQSLPAANPIDLVAPLANPAAWWNLLQDQFKQAVNTAMAPEPAPPAAKAKPAAPPRKRKSPSKKS
jgi:hypothetical protein